MRTARSWTVALSIVLTALWTVGAAQMDHGAMPPTDSDRLELTEGAQDEAFLIGMIAHHEGAVDMARWLLDRSDDAQVRAWAEDVLKAQAPEIEQMREWLEAWGLDVEGTDPVMTEGMARMLADMDISTTDAEATFLNAMTEHHAGAVAMATRALVTTDRQEIRDLARDVIVTQAQEIHAYQTYLAD